MEIIPAIYIIHGQCVALYKGSFEQKETYYKNPVQMAQHFLKEGAECIHVVDLDSRNNLQNEANDHVKQKGIITQLIKTVGIPVQLEASFNSLEAINEAFAIGVKRVVLRPFARNIFEEAIKTFGPEKIIVEIQSKGPDVMTGNTDITAIAVDVVDFAEKLVPLGVKTIIYKDERSEGTMIHPNFDEIDRLFLITGKDLKIYASGGIGEAKHLQLLKKIGAAGAIIGKAFYERKLTYQEAVEAVK